MAAHKKERPQTWVRFPASPPIWGSMFQGGEIALQANCGGFDSPLLHQILVMPLNNAHPDGFYTCNKYTKSRSISYLPYVEKVTGALYVP